MPETINAELIEQPSQQAVIVRPPQSVGLFGNVEPAQVIEKAAEVARALKDVLQKQKLISNIGGKEYPKCEAWTLLGTMLGVFPVLEWCRAVEGGWEARVLAKTKDGATVGAAEAECLRSEKNWASREDFALRSMAQTRATAKCLRMPLGFVMTLAGYEATPAEEMTFDHPKKPAPAAPERKPTAPTAQPEKKPASNAKQEPAAPIVATDATRKWMMEKTFSGPGGTNNRLAREYFQKLAQLMENEDVPDLPLRFVPVNWQELNALIKALREFGNGEPIVKAFEPHWTEKDPPPKAMGAKPESKPSPTQTGTTSPETQGPQPNRKDPEWWRDIIITVPRKGMKLPEYQKKPDTIGDLWELRHGNDDEAATARSRLFGLVHNWECKPREFKGKVYQPTDADKLCREALDAFWAFFEKNHPGEKL